LEKPKLVFENCGEIIRGREAGFISNFGNRVVLDFAASICLFQTDVVDVVAYLTSNIAFIM
jgi:hypothetical protein